MSFYKCAEVATEGSELVIDAKYGGGYRGYPGGGRGGYGGGGRGGYGGGGRGATMAVAVAATMEGAALMLVKLLIMNKNASEFCF